MPTWLEEKPKEKGSALKETSRNQEEVGVASKG
jgi:hypothetical protein